MAYKSKFLHFKTKVSYDAERAKTTAGTEERKVFDAYISFIDEGPMICTWGKEYKCDISASEVEALVNAGKISPATVEPLIAETAAVGTSTKYAREDHRHPAQTTVSGNAGTATKLQTPRVITVTGAISGSATFDGSSNVNINSTLNGFDASKIISGTINADILPEIPIEKIPAAALERLFVVESQSDAMNADVQEGDVVQIGSGGPMYFCVSKSASTFATKFKIFTAGTATSVPWSGVIDRPAFTAVATSGSYNDLIDKPVIPSLNGYATETWVSSQGFLKSVPAQTWDSITDKPSTFIPSAHNQSSDTITELTGYAKANLAAINPSDSLNSALGKLEAKVDSKFNAGGGTITGYTKISTSSNSCSLTINNTSSEINYVKICLTHREASVGNIIGTADKISLGLNNHSIGLYSNGAGVIDDAVIATQDWVSSNYLSTIPITTDSIFGVVKIGSNITVSSGTISLSKANVTSALGYTPANTSDIPEIPITLPNPYALTINGTSYTGSSAVSVTTPKILSVTTLSSSTVSAGYSYNNTTSRTISSLSGFSATNPDSVIISTAKLTFTASNAIKMDGLADLSGTYYIYCLSYMANGKIAVNGAVYA